MNVTFTGKISAVYARPVLCLIKQLSKCNRKRMKAQFLTDVTIDITTKALYRIYVMAGVTTTIPEKRRNGLWRFPTFSDGTKKWRQLPPRPAVPATNSRLQVYGKHFRREFPAGNLLPRTNIFLVLKGGQLLWKTPWTQKHAYRN